MSILIFIEILSFIGCLILAAAWVLNPEGNWEPILVLCTLIAVGVDIYRRLSIRSLKGRFESHAARIHHREDLRVKFEAEIGRCRSKELRQDIIIRHVDRVDRYPETDNEDPGISPWFRVALVDTYRRGIVLCLRIGGLAKCDGGFRFVDYVNGEKSDITVSLMGDVPYDSIEAVNMDGDEYYSYPHIYCHFDYCKEPYERLWFSQKTDQPYDHTYYKHIADYSKVTANNPDTDTLYFS